MDFPNVGFRFADISPLLLKPNFLADVTRTFATALRGFAPTKIVGVEARGLVFGAPLAAVLRCGFVMARKEGKVPGDKVVQGYASEYGAGVLEIPQHAIGLEDKVIVVDDFLATGGAVAACVALIHKLGGAPSAAAFLIEDADLGGRKKIQPVPIICGMSFAGAPQVTIR